MNTTILLQGYSHSPIQLRDDIEYYRSLGLNVVVSSYSNCTPLLDQTNVVNNDINEGVEIEDSMQPNTLGSNKQETYKVRTSNRFFTQPGFNLNFQIHTIKTGLKRVEELYPSTKYLLKLRADMKLYELDKFIPTWVENSKLESNILENKLTVKGPPGTTGSKEWKVYDFWTFGSYIDILNYYNLPYATSYHSPESYLTFYIRSKSKESWEQAKHKYFNYEDNIPTFWYKFNGWFDTSMETGLTTIFPKHIVNDRPSK